MGSAPQACLTEAASSPVQSCLLFSVMKINETVQSSAEATGALLTEEAFRLRQPFPARYHGTSERGRGGERGKRGGGVEGGEGCSLVLQQNDDGIGGETDVC